METYHYQTEIQYADTSHAYETVFACMYVCMYTRPTPTFSCCHTYSYAHTFSDSHTPTHTNTVTVLLMHLHSHAVRVRYDFF